MEDEDSGRDVCRQLALRLRRHGHDESVDQVHASNETDTRPLTPVSSLALVFLFVGP